MAVGSWTTGYFSNSCVHQVGVLHSPVTLGFWSAFNVHCIIFVIVVLGCRRVGTAIFDKWSCGTRGGCLMN